MQEQRLFPMIRILDQAMNTTDSDDNHGITLARVSGARLLFTEDQDLECDFKNATLVSNPSGKIYKGHKHQRQLARA